MKMHPTLTPDRIETAVRRRMSSLDNPGFCAACGEEVDGVEGDAREYECEHCGETAVYGAEELYMEVM